MNKFKLLLILGLFITGCSGNAEKTQTTDAATAGVVVDIAAEKTDAEEENNIEKSANINQEFAEIPDIAIDTEAIGKPITVGVMVPSNKDIGKNIIEGSQIAAFELIDKYSMLIKVVPIDVGNNIEDLECEITKLNEEKFDVVLGLLSDSQKKFIAAYIDNLEEKPKLINLEPGDASCCGITYDDQLNIIADYMIEQYPKKKRLMYLVLPYNKKQSFENLEKKYTDKGVELKIAYYNNSSPEKSGVSIHKISQNIQKKMKEVNGVASIVLTESNWKLKKIITHFKNNKSTTIVLAPLGNINERIQTLSERKGKFRNIMVVNPPTEKYDEFFNKFSETNHRRPTEAAFWSYSFIVNLKNHIGNLNEKICEKEVNLY